MATKKKAKSKGRSGGMATFIRAVDKKTAGKKIPAKEMVALGAKKGMKISLPYVYAVRSYKGKELKKVGSAMRVQIRNPEVLHLQEMTLDALLRRHAQELKLFILSRL